MKVRHLNAPEVARVLLLLVFTSVAAGYGLCRVNSVGRIIQKETEYTEVLKKAAAREIARQSDDMAGWGLTALGAIAAIIVVTKVHPSPGYKIAFIALGPALVFMVESLDAAWELRNRLSTSVAYGSFVDIDNIALLLVAQVSLFRWSLVCGGAFLLWYLCGIVTGRVQPYDNKS